MPPRRHRPGASGPGPYSAHPLACGGPCRGWGGLPRLHTASIRFGLDARGTSFSLLWRTPAPNSFGEPQSHRPTHSQPPRSAPQCPTRRSATPTSCPSNAACRDSPAPEMSWSHGHDRRATGLPSQGRGSFGSPHPAFRVSLLWGTSAPVTRAQGGRGRDAPLRRAPPAPARWGCGPPVQDRLATSVRQARPDEGAGPY